MTKNELLKWLEIHRRTEEVSVYDSDSNGSKFADHYTVVIGEGVFGMSDIPFNPGFGICSFVGDLGGAMTPNENWGDEVELSDLPKDVLQAIYQYAQEDEC